MFVVKRKQLEDLVKFRQLEFLGQMKQHLKKHFTHIISDLNEKELEFFINEGMEKAFNYGLETEYQLTVYFNLMLTLGIDFEKTEEFEWANTILSNNFYSPEEKITELIEKTEKE